MTVDEAITLFKQVAESQIVDKEDFINDCVVLFLEGLTAEEAIRKTRNKRIRQTYEKRRFAEPIINDDGEDVSENFYFVDQSTIEHNDGNFVVEIYRRKLKNCTCRKDAETALASVWAIELQQDNMEVCKSRVRALFSEYGYGDLDFDAVFKTNFIVDDALKVMKKWSLENEINEFSLK